MVNVVGIICFISALIRIKLFKHAEKQRLDDVAQA